VSRGADLLAHALFALALVAPREVRAQQGTLTVINAPAALSAPAAADYNAGFVVGPTAITFTVGLSGGGNTPRTTIVSIRSTATTMGGTKPIGDLQWRRADLGTWNSITTSDVVIQTVTPFRRNDPPWSNAIFFRALLSWTTDPPGSYLAPLVLTLTVTTP
jgi:hypothetical protein